MTKEDEFFSQEWTVEDWKKDWDGGKPPWWQDKIYWLVNIFQFHNLNNLYLNTQNFG